MEERDYILATNVARLGCVLDALAPVTPNDGITAQQLSDIAQQLYRARQWHFEQLTNEGGAA